MTRKDKKQDTINTEEKGESGNVVETKESSKPDDPTFKTRKKTAPEPKSRNTIFIRNIPFDTTNQDLEDYFSQVGPLRSCFIVQDQEKKSKGFGYCQFAINEDATRALEKTAFAQGKVLKIELAKRKPNEKSVVRNLAFHCTEQEIREAFGAHGTIVNLRMANSFQDGVKKFRGFCFIDYSSMAEANKAIQCMNRKKVANRIVAVDFSLPKEKYDLVMAKEAADDYESTIQEEEADEDDAMEVGSDSGCEEDEESEPEDDSQEADIMEKKPALKGDPSAMLFVRNLSFDSSEDDLREKFQFFGPLKYARITKDKVTGASRGTGFVCFKAKVDSVKCLEMFKAAVAESSNIPATTSSTIMMADPSTSDSSRPFVLAGRFLNIAKAVDKSEANKLTLEKSEARMKADKRNMYLMREGVIYPDTPIGQKIAPSEMSKRQASFALRRKLLDSNPNLFISKNRISVRNLGRTIDDSFLKYLAKYAVVGFWKQVEASERASLDQAILKAEEGEAPSSARRVLIKQAKIVRDNDRVDAKTKLGRSKGYGFIEFVSHADALACLRWLNANPTAIPVAKKRKEKSQDDIVPMKQTPIVEFAMENVLVLRGRAKRKEASIKGNAAKKEADEKKKNDGKKRKDGKRKRAESGKGESQDGKTKKKKKFFH